MLSIIGGKLKGSRLKLPGGKDFRPTLGKTREALFSVLTSRYQIEDFKCIDIFAGSGALGLEALSRGAGHAVFVENNKGRFALLKKNISQLVPENQYTLVLSDAIIWLAKQSWSSGPYLFFLDPPYETSLVQQAIDQLANYSSMLENSLLVIESPKKLDYAVPASMIRFQQKTYGQTKLDFFEVNHQE